MIRAGLIRKVASGIYSLLPIGLRALQKFEAIVREELSSIGAQEVFLPSIIPSDLWKESGRWEKYGKELLRIKDRHNNEFCYGPTHEEVITDLIRNDVRSYRQLPLILFQIQSKFRDEIRPRFGLMRGREFLMKDAYSFHETEEDLEKTYQDMRRVYSRIFERCGFRFKVVEADTGAIGGKSSAEFMIISNSGEDIVMECDRCHYAANSEAAEILPSKHNSWNQRSPERRAISTPELTSITQVSQFLNIPPFQLLKSLVYVADGKPVMAVVRGDHEVNECKLKKVLECAVLTLAEPSLIRDITGADVGFSGPIGLRRPLTVLADFGIQELEWGVIGANQTDAHFMYVVPGRDFPEPELKDIRLAKEGDLCPKCSGGKFRLVRGIEVGHIFKLGDTYSHLMAASFSDAQGHVNTYQMGCYGIGIGRTVAAAIEQSHDKDGIIWPMALAPYHVEIILTNNRDENLIRIAESVFQECRERGIETLYDDRDDSAGKKFKDADLIGFPIQVIIGKKFKEKGFIELKMRSDGTVVDLKKEELVSKILSILS